MSEVFKEPSISREEIASHSIRANHELITDLCMAKEAVEQINNELPDVFGLMSQDGRVIRGNNAYASLVRVDLEDIGSTSLRSLFTSASWSIMLNALDRDKGDGSPVSLELPIDAVSADQLFHWTFSSFRAVSDRRGRLRSFIGKDITKLREMERKLASIFAAIPLGVITVNKEREIEWPYSAYSEVLLGKTKLETFSAEEGIFGQSKRFMNPSQIEGMRLLFMQIGAEEEWYDMAKDQLPKEIPFGTDVDLEPSAWRALTYNPIVREGRVEKILVVVEDITDRVRQRMAMTSRLSKEQKIAQIIFDLQEADKFMLTTCVEDIQLYLDEAAILVQAKAPVKQLCNKLHGIKGVARTLNLTTFKEFVHEMEDRLIRHAEDIDKGEIHRLRAEYSRLDGEWQEALKYIKVFQSVDGGGAGVGNVPAQQVATSSLQPSLDSISKRRDDILKNLASLVSGASNQALGSVIDEVRALTFMDLGTITIRLEKFFEMTANKLGKTAALEFNWGSVKLDYSKLPSVAELLYHLITNALDHGIEAPEVRKARGKSTEGRLVITAKDIGDSVEIECKDDGDGIDSVRVLEIARTKGLVDEKKTLSNREIWNLILLNGFSTAAAVTDTSGRGIGLDAVDERIRALGGAGLKVQDSARGVGTTFNFSIKKAL